MSLIDARTIIISYMISNAVCANVVALAWVQNRKRFAGLGFWLADFMMQFVALVLIVLRGVISDFISVVVSNALLISGTILLYMGLERFVGKRSTQIHNVVFLGVFILVHSYFVYVQPSLEARAINFSVGLLVICSQCAWLLLRRTNAEMRSIVHGVGIVFVLYSLVSLFRILVDLAFPLTNDLFSSSNVLDTFLIMANQMLFIVLTLNLFLMVNRRLLVDLEGDISERKRAEEKLQQLARAVEQSPSSIVIANTAGNIEYVNPKFSRLTGYSLEEAVGQNPRILKSGRTPPEAYRQLWNTVTAGKEWRGEFANRKKNGELYYESASISPIMDANGVITHYLAVKEDITERKRTEEVIQLRLRLNEFAATHSLDELLQKALDEIGLITGSPIGFYHFVGPDQKTLSLQAWSTRTLEEFCHAEGKGMSYDLDQAGVWVDCVRQREPVIHNNYVALPHRKGFPEGHAEVVRELVVPTMRDGRVVSVLGVGNKPSDYDEKDAEFVSYIADIVWVLVERKRAEEKILLLQAELQEQAIRDPLTGLYNRRYLNESIGRELARAEREGYPVSFVILDIDHFKKVNDTLGHDIGDIVLQDLAAQLTEQTRASDIVFRYGGEEFLLVFPNSSTEATCQIAERLRLSFQTSILLSVYQEVPVTLSLGVATFPIHAVTMKELLTAADRAMYTAKARGRNCVAVWQDEEKV